VGGGYNSIQNCVTFIIFPGIQLKLSELSYIIYISDKLSLSEVKVIFLHEGHLKQNRKINTTA